MPNKRIRKRNSESRKWLPNFAELIDRLSIHQLKEVFISEHKDKYAKEMLDIVHDINLAIDGSHISLTGELIHLIVCLAQINEHIWYNESKARAGQKQDLELLKLTHSLNGLRNSIMNSILADAGLSARKDYKIDCLAAEHKSWRLSILDKNYISI
jgi:hypothetical protein